MVDRSGRKSTVARNVTGIGLAWAPRGHEIWFTAVTPGGTPQLRATTLAGAERTVIGATDWLVLHDIAADGSALSRNTVRNGMSCQPGRAPNDLEWMLSSIVSDLSDDGTTVVFRDTLSGMTQAGNPSMFLRKLDGSAAIPLGEGGLPRLSPDGKWVLVMGGDNAFSSQPAPVQSSSLARGSRPTARCQAGFLIRSASRSRPFPGRHAHRGYVKSLTALRNRLRRALCQSAPQGGDGSR